MQSELNRHLGWAWLPGPLAMCGSTVLVVAHGTGQPVSAAGATMFFAGVTAAYMLDRWVDPPGGRRPAWCLLVAGPAILMGLVAAAWLPWVKIGVAVALGLVGLAYRSLKKFPLLKNALVAGSWAAAGLGFSIAGFPPARIGVQLGAAIFAVFLAGAMLCDMKDAAADAREGVRTAVVLWGGRAASFLAGALAAVGAVVAASAGRPGLFWAGVALMALAALPKITTQPVLGPVLIDGALALPAVLILTGLA